MLAGVLRANNVLTALNMGPGGELNESDREEIGRALLTNRAGKVGYCDLFGLVEGMKPAVSFDLRDKDQVRSLRSFAQCMHPRRGRCTVVCARCDGPQRGGGALSTSQPAPRHGHRAPGYVWRHRAPPAPCWQSMAPRVHVVPPSCEP